MENQQGLRAAEELRELDKAIGASTRASVEVAPPGFWAMFALLGPGIVGARSDTEWARNLGLVTVALVVLVSIGVAVMSARRLSVRRPLSTGVAGRWAASGVAGMLLGLAVALNSSTDGREVVIAVAVYIWLAVIMTVCWRRYERTVLAA